MSGSENKPRAHCRTIVGLVFLILIVGGAAIGLSLYKDHEVSQQLTKTVVRVSLLEKEVENLRAVIGLGLPSNDTNTTTHVEIELRASLKRMEDDFGKKIDELDKKIKEIKIQTVIEKGISAKSQIISIVAVVGASISILCAIIFCICIICTKVKANKGQP